MLWRVISSAYRTVLRGRVGSLPMCVPRSVSSMPSTIQHCWVARSVFPTQRPLRMTASRSTKLPPQPWSVPVALDDIAEIGQHFDLVAEDATRAAVARTAGLRELPRLEASFDVTRHGAGGLRVAGKVSA